MDVKKRIHNLILEKNYLQLYKEYPLVLNEMLFIENQEEFEDFIKENNEIQEDIFWFFYSASIGNSVLIGVYEADVYDKFISYLQTKLPFEILEKIKGAFDSIYMNVDENKTVEPFIERCNNLLKDTKYFCIAQFDDTYCAGVYFVEVIIKE